MKLISAGIDGLYSPFLYNCTRNKSCQQEYFVPIRQLSDLMFFVDLPGKPDELGVNAKIMDICCVEGGSGEFDPGEFNDDFFIGEVVPCGYDLVFPNYVIGQKPDGSWYGVFANPIASIPEDKSVRCFFVKLEITFQENVYNFYSEQICIEKCDPLTYLQGCYPNLFNGDAEDCNGIYYGFHRGPEEHLGTLNFRYFHWAYVRLGHVSDSKMKLSFTVFNSKKTYKTEINKDKLFEFEVVPEFYKDHLFGIFARGNIKINGKEYRLLEQQEFSAIDSDSRWWLLDIQLTEYCKQTFGCGQSDCQLPEEPPEECEVPECEPNLVELEGNLNLNFTGDNCELEEGESIEWRMEQLGVIIDEGTIENLLDIVQVEGTDPEQCYLFSWRKKCADGQVTPWQYSQYGDCGAEPNVCYTDGIGSWTGTFSLVVDEGGQRSVAGNLQCSLGCPCELVTGTHVARYDPSSECLAGCNIIDTSGEWMLGATGYLTYIGPGLIIPCGGLDLSLLFEATNCCEMLEIQAGAGGATLNWEDCESGTPQSQFVNESEQLARCGRAGGFSVDGNHTVVSSGEPC